jgi:cell wall-associated NlpC family hydrolase
VRGFRLAVHILMLVALALVVAPPASAATTGGAEFESKKDRKAKQAKRFKQRTAGPKAVLLPNGLAAAPAEAPPEVHDAIEAANKIIGKPYKYGGGHAKIKDSGYDCSGTVSFALIGAGLLKTPLDSGSFMSWGKRGKGDWITVYTNPGHAFMVIAGLRLDTSAAGDPSGAKGPRWRPVLRSTRGFKARHPKGF